LLALASVLAGSAFGAGIHSQRHGGVRVWTIPYRAHDGQRRNAYLLLPASYSPTNHPAIPLIISPHGRGVTGRANARLWGSLPAQGTFAVINPDGEGRLLPDYSWGSAGQIEDLARMPTIVTRALPWLRLDWRRIYAFGGSMGGQESLLLAARHPQLLAGTAAFDSVTDLALQYHSFPHLQCARLCHRTWAGPIGRSLQQLARREIGGPPGRVPYAYKLRSPITYARSLAASCMPLQLWWSTSDRIVLMPNRQSGRLFHEIRRLNPAAPVQAFVGYWTHSAEMRATSRLPLALSAFDLLPESKLGPRALRWTPPPENTCKRP
jgi:pimeloyl-ACP methyl ester carboxylesterase